MSVSVIMQSCSKFEEICKTTINSFAPYSCIKSVYLATNSVIQSNFLKKTFVIQLSRDDGFSSNMLSAASKIDDDIVLVLLDDYVLPNPKKQPVDTEKLIEDACLLLRNDKNAACVRFNIFDKSCADLSVAHMGFYKVKRDFKYLCSLQPSLWNLSHLKSILKSGENAWEAELNGSKRMRKMGVDAYISSEETLIHINALKFGKYMRDKFVDYADVNNINIPPDIDVFVKEKKSEKKSEKKIMNLNSYRKRKK